MGVYSVCKQISIGSRQFRCKGTFNQRGEQRVFKKKLYYTSSSAALRCKLLRRAESIMFYSWGDLIKGNKIALEREVSS